MCGKITAHIKDYALLGITFKKAAFFKKKLCKGKVFPQKAEHKNRTCSKNAPEHKPVLKFGNKLRNFRRAFYYMQKIVCGNKSAAAVIRRACSAAEKAKAVLLLNKAVGRKSSALRKSMLRCGGFVFRKVALF